MSHFPVMIITKEQVRERVLKEMLAPFDERTKDERFLRFVELDEEELNCEKEHYQENYANEYSFDEYMENKTHYKFNEETNQYGYEENPNAKWDWWVIGGRWRNFLLLKNAWNADFAQVKSIDFERMIKRQKDFYAEIWEEITSEKVDKKNYFAIGECQWKKGVAKRI